MELLLDDRIDLVTLVGSAGTGKTLITLATGLKRTFDDENYRRLLVCRPIVPVGRDLGFLPGTMEEKLDAWMGAIYDNLSFLAGIKNPEEGEEEVVLPNEGRDIPAEAPESDENKENNADKPLYENECSKNDKVDSICHQFNNFMDDIFNIQDWGSNSLEHKFIGFEIDYDADYQNGTLTIDGYCKDTKQIGSASWMLNEEQATKLLKLLGYNQQALPHESVNGYKASIDVLEGRSFEELFEIELILNELQADLEEIISNENIKG